MAKRYTTTREFQIQIMRARRRESQLSIHLAKRCTHKPGSLTNYESQKEGESAINPFGKEMHPQARFTYKIYKSQKEGEKDKNKERKEMKTQRNEEQDMNED